MKIKRQKGLKGKCDEIFGKIIRSKGACERCGRRPPDVQLQTAHIISRRYSATRTDENNAFCLCAADHRYYTDWPKEFSDFVTEKLGDENYQRLKAKAQAVTKVDWSIELERLKKIWQGIDKDARDVV